MHKCYPTAKGSEIPAYCRVCPEPLSQEGNVPLFARDHQSQGCVRLLGRTSCLQAAHLHFPIVAALTLQASFNFMAAVTICSDFGAQKIKVSHCFPNYLP